MEVIKSAISVIQTVVNLYFRACFWLLFKFIHKINGISHLEKKSIHFLVDEREIHPILTKSASDLAQEIREGNLTAVKVCQTFIDQIKKTDKFLNAITTERFEDALIEAREIDENIMALRSKSPNPEEEVLKLGQFLGVPTVAKECHEVEGLSFTIGLVGRKDRIGKETCTTVKRMEAAGFIILGLTNVSEACMWFESYNPVYGTTNNPFDLSRTPGGSSGGAGALMGACAVPVAITSDVGGSIRIPAYFCGLYGHKATGGTVPNTRTDPQPAGKIYRFCQMGPTTRYAKDLMPILKVMAGPDGEDPECYKFELGDPKSVELKGLRVVTVDEVGNNHFVYTNRHKKQKEAHERVLAYLEKQGCEIIRLETIPHMESSFLIWSAMMQKETTEMFGKTISEGLENEIWPIIEFLKGLFGRSIHTLPASGLASLDVIFDKLPDFSSDHELQKGEELKQELKKIIGDGVMIYPSIPFPAPYHYMSLHQFLDSVATSIFNVTELPSTQVPLGLDDEGIPMGVQIVANHERDHTSIGVAMHLENAGVTAYEFPQKLANN